MTLDIEAFFKADKTIPIPPDWFVLDSEWIGFACPLDVDGVTLAGFRLQAKAMLRQPDRHVVMQLEHLPPTDKGGAICRIEWRPFSGHNNKGNGPANLRFKDILTSHLHPFDLNWRECEKSVRRGQLPIALPLDPDPPNYREFLALVGIEFRIENIQCVVIPPWQPVII
jgi:hypothetical protein